MNRNTVRVIIVDDDRGVQKTLNWQLNYRKIQIIKTLGNGTDLLAFLKENKSDDDLPTAILVDYVLPDMQGRELVKSLIKNYPKIPIIVMSGKDIQGSISAYAMGAYAIMQKPIDYNELEITLLELASRNHAATSIAVDLLKITEADCVLVWEMNRKAYPNYKVTASIGGGADKAFVENTSMNSTTYPRVGKMQKERSGYYDDLQSENNEFRQKEEAKARGWKTLLWFAFYTADGKLAGWIDCYKTEAFNFKHKKDQKHKMVYLEGYARLGGENLQAQILKEQSRIIQETNQNIAGTLNENLIYNSILTKAIAATYADCAWIYRYDPELEKIFRAAAVGEGAILAADSREIEKGGITGKVAKTGISLYIKDVNKAEPEIYDPQKNHISTPDLEEKSIIAVPLRRGERTLGVLTVMSKDVDFFRPDDLQLLVSLAAIAAVGMERRKLMHHLEEMSKKAQLATDFEELAIYVVHAVKDLTDATVNLWMMSDQDGEGDEYLRLRQSSKPNLKDVYKIIPTSPEKSIAGLAMEKEQHVLIPDLENYDGNPPFVNEGVKKKEKWRSLLTVPLIGKRKEKLGVLSLLHTDIQRFSEDDATLIQHFANQAALALQEQRHLETLQELARTGQELTTTLTDTKTYLKKVVDLACRVSKAKSVVIYPYDPKRKLFYSNEFNLAGGKIDLPKEKLTEKPRKKGLTALIRAEGAIRVEKGGEDEPLRIFAGTLNQQTPVAMGTKLYEMAIQFVRESHFISREKIQSFIGVSLVAEAKAGQLEEVAVMYFNYRIPRHFTEEELRVIDIFCHQIANVIHRNRLFNELEEERKLIEGVHNSALTILQEQGQEKRLNKIVEEATFLLGAEGGKIYLTINGSQKDLQLVAKYNLPDEIMKLGTILRQRDGAGMALTVARTGKYLIENDYPKSKYKVPKLKSSFSAVVEVPLLLRGNVIGVLGVFDRKERQEFTDASVRILERLAAQAALAIYNVRLYGELDALNKAGLEISRNRGPRQMAENILKELKHVIEYDRATIQQIHSLGEQRETLAHNSEKERDLNVEFTRPVSEDKLIGPIVYKPKPIVLSDTHQSKLWDTNYEATKEIRSWVGVPLVYDEKVLGILMLDHKSPGYYTEEDLPKLQRFALQAAIGINNSLFEHTYLKVLQDFALLVQSDTLNKRETFEEMIKSFKKILSKHELTFKYYFVDEKLLTKEDIPEEIQFDETAGYSISLRRVIQERLPFRSEEPPLIALPIIAVGEIAGILEISSGEQFPDNFEAISSTLVAFSGEAIYKIGLRLKKVDAYVRRFNPYITGPPIKNPKDFFGRIDIVQSILDQIHNNHFLIIGERRIGKTSLLFHLEHHIKNSSDEEYVFYSVYMDLEKTKEEELWRHLADTVQSIDGKMHSIKDLNYSFDDFRADLKILLNRLLNVHKDHKLRIVLLMDEIDVLRKYGEGTLSKIRNVFQENNELKVIMAGVEIKPLTEDINSAWYNQLNLVELNAINQEQARLLIIQPVAPVYSYTEEAIAKIINLTECKPLIIQRLCSKLVESMLKRMSKATNSTEVDLTIIAEDVPNTL